MMLVDAGAVFVVIADRWQFEWHPAQDTWEPRSIREGRRPRPPTLKLGQLGRVVFVRLRAQPPRREVRL